MATEANKLKPQILIIRLNPDGSFITEPPEYTINECGVLSHRKESYAERVRRKILLAKLYLHLGKEIRKDFKEMKLHLAARRRSRK